jgi:hypothetical protein
VVLDGSIRDEENADILNPADATTYENIEVRYHRARFEACRDGLWFSMALNAIFIVWIAWAACRW